MPTVNPPLQEATPYNEATTPFEHETPDKAHGGQTDSFHLSQCSDHLCDFEIEDVDDLSEIPTVNDEDEINLDKEAADPPLSQFVNDYHSQPLLENSIPTETQ